MTNGKQNYRVFPRRNFGGNWSRWSEFTAVFLRWICRAASLGKPLYVERKPFTVQLLNGRKSAHGPQGRDVTHILCKVSYFFFCWNPFIFVGYGNDLFSIPGAHLSIQILIFRILCNNVNVSQVNVSGRRFSLSFEGEKRRPEMRLLFAGYVNVGRCLHFELGLPVAIVASHTEVSAVCVCVWGGGGGGGGWKINRNKQ